MAHRPVTDAGPACRHCAGRLAVLIILPMALVGCFPQAAGIPTPLGGQTIPLPPQPPVVYAPTATPRPSPSPQATATSVPPPTLTPVPAATPTATATADPVPQPFVLTGTGAKVTSFFHLAAGLAVFRLNHDGFAAFSAVLYDRLGNQVAVLADAFGAFDGAKAVQVGQDGDYALDVTADRRWSVGVEQPRPASAPLFPSPLGGRGQRVSPFFTLNPGLAAFHLWHYGQDDFLVVLLDRSGYPVATLVNAPGQFDGSRPIQIDTGGIYLLNIQADGDWVIQLGQ